MQEQEIPRIQTYFSVSDRMIWMGEDGNVVA